MKAKHHFISLAATALAGLCFFTLSSAAIAANNTSMSSNRMSHSSNSMSQNTMSRSLSKSKIKAIQRALKKKGMNVDTDGVMGPNTKQALRQYQKKHGLKATGRPDQATCKSLGVSMGHSSMMNKQSHDKKWHHGDNSTGKSRH